MKKTLLFLSLFLMSAGLFAQITILTLWEFGPTSFSPVVTFNGAPDDMEIVSYISVQNTGPTDVTIKVAREEVNVIGDAMNQFCWGGVCFSPDTDTSANSMTLAPGELTDEFSGHYQSNGNVGISFIRYTFWDVSNPENYSSVLVSYNNIFEITCEDGDFLAKHTRMLNGNVDDTIHGVIKVHNHVPTDLNLIAFKQPVSLVTGSTNWFSFGGNEYPFGVDTSAMVTIPGSIVDESFEMFYDADGNEGVSEMVYVFLDVTNPSNYALYWIHFNAEITGISDNILENTTFSAAYPNPAESFVSFDYDIPAEVNRAEILITNLLGAVVYQSTLSGLNGTERIDVSNFTEGIYFATLKLDNNIVTSQKILVQ
ncbi:MAG: T9SS type A sorting domain-containing protein [Bacteroidales bacterium]|nr:T9SS type A sorting domain-containing protein [Bacteroidales bacterium]